MGNYFPQGCNFTFLTAWEFDTRSPFHCDIRLFPDDPYGSPQAHGSPTNNTDVPPQWTCSHPGGSNCYSSNAPDGLNTVCEYFPNFNEVSDPPGSVPFYIGSGPFGSQTVNDYRNFAQGRGHVRPTMYELGITNPLGRYPMNGKPARSYHNGMWNNPNAGSLPAGWYIWTRYHNPRFFGPEDYPLPYLWRFFYSTITFADSGGPCIPDGRQNVCDIYTPASYNGGGNNYYYWFYGGRYSCLNPSSYNLQANNYFYHQVDILLTNGFITNPNFNLTRRQFESTCTPCL